VVPEFSHEPDLLTGDDPQIEQPVDLFTRLYFTDAEIGLLFKIREIFASS
jgi:hypothetical protein